jgi:hypothetical protein
MESTALYYTFSTVSQTLAGALGMLAAFLALRAAALEGTFNAAARELERMTGRWGQQASLRTRAELVSFWRSVLSAEQTGAGQHRAVLATAEAAHESRERMLAEARRAFVASAAVMAACFVALAMTPLLSRSAGVSVVALGLLILAAVACLYWYGRIVREALA